MRASAPDAAHYHRSFLVLAVLAALLTLWFSVRSYRSLIVLQMAYSVGLPASSSVRGWMSLRYVAETFKVPADRLTANLGLKNEAAVLDSDLRSLARQSNSPVLQYVQRVQQALANSGAVESRPRTTPQPSWFESFHDRLLSYLLAFGYPALAGLILLGALGLPVPSGFAAAFAGSLSASGKLAPSLAVSVIALTSMLADMLAFYIGARLGGGWLDRHGRWIGLSAQRRVRLTEQFSRWGGAMVLLSRTLASSLSTVVSLIAGVSHYQSSRFLVYVVAGRLVWTLSYFGLGYAVSWSVDVANGFLTNLSGLVFAALLTCVFLLLGMRRQSRELRKPAAG